MITNADGTIELKGAHTSRAVYKHKAIPPTGLQNQPLHNAHQLKEMPKTPSSMLRKNSAKSVNYVGKTDGPLTGIAPVGYAAGGLGGPGVNVNRVQEFLEGLDNFESEFAYNDKTKMDPDLKDKKAVFKDLDNLAAINYNKYFYGLVPHDPKNKFYYGMKTGSYYGHTKPIVPEINRGVTIEGNFYPMNDQEEAAGVEQGYYKRQMAANEFKNFNAPRVLANNERPPDERLDPKVIDSANSILQHQEKLKTHLRDKFRKNNVTSKNKLKDMAKNKEIEGVYHTIEDQQRLILDLVNNVVSDREKDLKHKNDILR